LAQRVVLSPAERAVLVEQLETLKVNLDAVVGHLKDGTVKDSLDAWSQCFPPWDYARDVISRKVSTALYEIHVEERHEG
jgi:hypothetical protein